MEKENVNHMGNTMLKIHIDRLEQENKELKNLFDDVSRSVVNYGELSRCILHGNQIINDAGGWDKLSSENVEEICATIREAARKIGVRKMKMNTPENTALPFFAYGIFKPGEISYYCIKDDLLQPPKQHTLQKKMWIRDGIPLLGSADDEGKTKGYLLSFVDGEKAYAKIASLEPDSYYEWSTFEIDGEKINYLAGKKHDKGNVRSETDDWNSWDDPIFTKVFVIIDDHLERLKSDSRLEPENKCLEYQMLYLLLWTSIERFTSFRFGLGKDKPTISEKNKLLSTLPEFQKAHKQVIDKFQSTRRIIYSNDLQRHHLDSSDPKKFIAAHYTVRSTIAHRGKAVFKDAELVLDCLLRMKTLFKTVIDEAHTNSAIDLDH